MIKNKLPMITMADNYDDNFNDDFDDNFDDSAEKKQNFLKSP